MALARMMKVEDVMEELRISKSGAYRVINEINEELERSGLKTIRGRVSREHFEKVYFDAKPGDSK